MRLIIEDEVKVGQSRLTFLRLVGMQLRLLNLWRDAAGGHQEALVQMAVAVILGDRAVSGDTPPPLLSLANPMPTSRMGRCNLSSIAAATGLNRETVRRIVNRLVVDGPLIRSRNGVINFTPGWSQGPESERLAQMQLEEFYRTANLLLRDGVLSLPTPQCTQDE